MNSLRPRTFTDYLRAARSRASVIIATAIVLATATFIAVKRLPSVYESFVSVIIEQAESDPPIEPARQLVAIEQQLASRARLETVIARCGLINESGARLEDMISRMRACLRVNADAGRDNQFRITYRAADPVTAQKIAGELAALLLSDSANAAPATSSEANLLREQATELSAEVRAIEEKAPWLVTLKDAAPAIVSQPARSTQPSADALRAQQMTIESLKDRQYLIQQQLADIERRIASEKQIVEQQKNNSTLRDNPTYAVLIAKRAELQGQRDTLINRQELTDKHPRVTAITDQISAINRQIEELRQQDSSQMSQSPEARELMSLESERNRLKLELEVNNREMTRRSAIVPVQAPAPAIAARPAPTSSRLAEQYFALKRNYEEVTAKLDDAESKRAAGGSAKPGRIRLLNEAILPEQPKGPNRWLFTLAALTAGLALGACFALATESRRFRYIQDAQDAHFYTRLPLLAAIPKTVTPAESKNAARRARLRMAVGALIAAVSTIALAQLFILTNIFTLIG